MLKIRNATPSDAARLLEIYDYYVKSTAITFEYVTPTLDEFKRRMSDTMRRYPYFVLEENRCIKGYSYASAFVGRAAYDWSCEMTIYLDKDSRGHGAGKILYEAMEKELKKMGITNLYACVAYPEKDDEFLTAASTNFHKRLGYKAVGHFQKCGCKFGRWYDMLWLEKIIAQHTENPAPITAYPLLLSSDS